MLNSVASTGDHQKGHHHHADFGKQTGGRVSRLLELDHIAQESIIFQSQGEKVAIIDYTITPERHSCYISFFGTQNGDANRRGNKRILLLDTLDANGEKEKGLSYDAMEAFITEVCKPNGIQKIYLDADDSGKIFWKEKIGRYFRDKGIFTRVGSIGFEVCFDLSFPQ